MGQQEPVQNHVHVVLWEIWKNKKKVNDWENNVVKQAIPKHIQYKER